MKNAIYIDCLGIPQPKAHIDYFPSVLGNGTPHYALGTTLKNVDCPEEWPEGTSLEAMIADMEADGWACTILYENGRTCNEMAVRFKNCMAVIDCVHTATAQELTRRREENAAKFANGTPGYVRFGSLPAGGRSKNFASGNLEDGVSCFHAKFAPDGSFTLTHMTPVLECSFLTVMTRPAFRVFGEEISVGSDGEPVLRVERAQAI